MNQACCSLNHDGVNNATGGAATMRHQAGWEASLVAGPNNSRAKTSSNKLHTVHRELRHCVVPEEEHLPALQQSQVTTTCSMLYRRTATDDLSVQLLHVVQAHGH